MGDSGDPEAPVPHTWDIQADVVVVGFGAAGACAALEAAAAGCDVIVLDRFTGGGATALSGGVIFFACPLPARCFALPTGGGCCRRSCFFSRPLSSWTDSSATRWLR